MVEAREEFHAGEKVVYSQFGLGTITGITEKHVNGSSFSFYRLEFPMKHMEILVPVHSALERGMRRVMSTEEVEEVLAFISCAAPDSKPQQWHRWRKKTLEQLKSGDLREAAQIFCYLNKLETQKGLSFTERKILTQVEQIIISEVAVAMDIGLEAAGAIVTEHRRDAQARYAENQAMRKPGN